MATMMEEVLNKKFSRRDFLKGTVAATAAVAGLGLAGKENNLASAENVAPAEHPEIVNPETGGILFVWQNLVMTLVFGGVAYLLWRVSDNCRVEYDYTFTNGCLDVSRVLNNKRRKYLTALEMKDVIRCGPATGPAFQKTLSEPGIKCHNWFVNRDAKLYYFYFQRKGVKHVIVLELTDEMVAMIRSKNYLPREAWYDAEGRNSYAAGIS